MSRKSPVCLSLQRAWLVVLLSLALLPACGPDPTPVPSPTPEPPGNITKVGSILQEVLLKYNTAPGSQAEKQQAALDFARERGIINKKNEVVFQIELEDPGKVGVVGEKIKSMGGRVLDNPNIEGTVKMRVAVPASTLITYANSTTHDNFMRDLADFQGIKSIEIVVPMDMQELANFPQTKEALLALYQSSVNQGVMQMGADKWQAAGFKGMGVKLGVIDGGFKFYSEFLGKTLPAELDMRDQDKEDGEDGVLDEDIHGTAVLEILYSLAPEAEFHAVAVDRSENEIAEALDYLADKGVDIISISLGGHGGSGQGTDAIDRKIDSLRQKGIIFFISAGNEGDEHYAGTFDPDDQGFHQWQPGVTRLGVGNLTGAPFKTGIILNWEQWENKTRTDLDLFLEDKDGNPLASSANDQRRLDPLEIIPFSPDPRKLYYLRVRIKPGAPPPATPFRLHIFTRDLLLQFYTPVLAIANPADSKGAFAVGAVQWNKDTIATYSSQGPLPNGAFKPELSAPAGVSSTAYRLEGETSFDGTSAACPEAAGLAAVIKSANLKLKPDELAQLVMQSVKDLGPGGPDTAYGYGRVDLTDTTPGDISLKGKIPAAPTSNPNPALNLKTSSRFPPPIAGGNSRANTPLPTQAPIVTTVAPTAEPLPAIGPVTFHDDFQNSNSGLPNNGPTVYSNGAYQVKAGENQLVWSAYPGSMRLTNFSAEVNVQGINDASGVYGMVFWLQSANNYYLLSVTGNGLVQVSQFNGGQWRQLFDWVQAPGWKNAGPNSLRLVAIEGQLSVGINNKVVKSSQATGEGVIGFAAGGYSRAASATFTGFKLNTRG